MTNPIGIQNKGKFRKMPLETLQGENRKQNSEVIAHV
jgi:hypothetical protein